MSILEALTKDHRHLETLLGELAAVPRTEPQQRLVLFSQLQSLLQAHSRAEEVVVYERLCRKLPNDETTLEGYEEHHLADLLTQELASTLPGGPGWSAKARVLEELLRHHIKEEELDLFPLVSAQFDESAQHLMQTEFTALKHEKFESLLGPLRCATPAFAGRAAVDAQAAAGRYARRGELQLRHAWMRLNRKRTAAAAKATPASPEAAEG